MQWSDPLMIEDAGGNAAPEIFTLTDEQILGMEAELEEVASDEWRVASEADSKTNEHPSAADALKTGARSTNESAQATQPSGEKGARAGAPVGQEPPAWLAREMKDPWVGDEARELWEGVQRAQREAAAYREAFSTPEDARALKEIYPGGVAEAKSAAERARELTEIDAVFFGAAGKPAEELRAGRAALVEKLYAQNPAAFREMVEAGVKVLQAGPGEAGNSGSLQSESQTARLSGRDDTARNGPGARTSTNSGANAGGNGAQPGMTVPQEVANRYREFERSANAELEKSVGGTIARAMEQALPNLRQGGGDRQGLPLQERLRTTVREEVESALRSDASLGEQVARILGGRRLDEAARAQVVRLIDARAQQLVPGAVRRVVGSWTQATLGARKTDGGAESVGRGVDERRAERAPNPSQRTASGDSGGERNAQTAATASRSVSRGRVDYRKLSDEQILGM